MKLKTTSDTIAAIATPPGEGGIAVIRVSGMNALDIVGPLFSGKRSLHDSPSHMALLGEFGDGVGGCLDSVLATVFRAPHSYTGETVVEVSCHGGYFISRCILDTVIAKGARHALPGEFTERAFLNGKIDLSQAEAVAELIHARSESARKASYEQLHGRLGDRIRTLRRGLLDLCSLLELELDFSEEGIQINGLDNVLDQLAQTIKAVEEMSATFASGKLIREGVRTVLAGRPNTGKSSLLNILLQENRAIVSEIPGTTRDVIEESVSIDGMLFRLADTAGLRKTVNEIEKEGIRRTEHQLDRADLVLYLMDTSQPLDPEDISLIKPLVDTCAGSTSRIILVLNKSDVCLSGWSSGADLAGLPSVMVSCKEHRGIDTLKRLLVDTIMPLHDHSISSPLILSSRHKAALDGAALSLRLAQESVQRRMSFEFVAVDIHGAMDALGEIIGYTTPEDVLQNIFSQFCIGK
ncbi:MAG: tRNA uridine-5-carboxymethylaminomethyl(34) synthesis GTPase MnmE [Ignavibacteriales bacterium]|nr:tRNA uridine-5-carboxymethylaminomethyl(34) synthesis GTPase MnmE [Ignavibacteriales bacterium]